MKKYKWNHWKTNKNFSKQQTRNIVWIFSHSKKWDFWFIDVLEEKKWYFVHQKNQNTALDWDEVEASIKVFRWREEAIIKKIIKRSHRTWIGKIELVKEYGFVILENPAIQSDVYVSAKDLQLWKNTIKHWDRVAIEIIDWKKNNPYGKIIQNLGSQSSIEQDLQALILESWIQAQFDSKTLQEAQKLIFETQSSRQDLTKKLFYTIDWEDAKDLDDAICIEKVWEKYKLYVSIADVSEYVKPNTSLDKEALKRSNSTYLVDRVLPMLPSKLSDDLCSLLPHTKKPTLTCEILLDKDANILEKKVYESVIISQFRLTYKEVQEIINHENNIQLWCMLHFGWRISQELISSLNLAYELKEKIIYKKQLSWVLDFDFSERYIKIDENKNPIELWKKIRYDSSKVIEEFMILANNCVGEIYHTLPFVFRIHPYPSEDDIDLLRKNLAVFWVFLPQGIPTQKDFFSILEKIKTHPYKKILQKMVLRSMSKAIYSEKNIGHFWLNLKHYSHFTSPIRRYSDLLIHRIIKLKLHHKFSKKEVFLYRNILGEITWKISQNERISEKLEYDVKDYFTWVYYEKKIGEKLLWEISWMIPSGCFVELDDGAEWFLSFEQIGNTLGQKFLWYDEDMLMWVFSKWWKLKIGERVLIQVREVEALKKRINFDFLEKIIQ